MGTWGEKAFDNDQANDWAYGLEEAEDLGLVEEALEAVEATGAGYLDADLGVDALAACEVLARLLGNPGYRSAHTEKVDTWVEAHRGLVPPAALLRRAEAAIARVLAEPSELKALWEEGEGSRHWRAEVEDLRKRLAPGTPR